MNKLTILLVSVGGVLIIGGGVFVFSQMNKTNKDSETSTQINTEDKATEQTESNKQNSIVLMYNGETEGNDDTSGASENAGLLFMESNSDTNNVYFISRSNYGLWSASKKMPAELEAATQSYEADISDKKKLTSEDKTVTYYEITKLNSMIKSEE